MTRDGLRDDQWERIKDLLPGKLGDVGVTARDNRRFVEAVLYKYRAGIPWRDPHAAICMFLGGNVVTRSRFSGTTGSACRSTRSAWSAVASSGRRRPIAHSQSPRRSSPICLMALTGGTQSKPDGQKQP